MAIFSRPFGSTTLSGAEAVAFARFLDVEPPKAARESVKRGTVLVREFLETGRVTLPLPPPPAGG